MGGQQPVDCISVEDDIVIQPEVEINVIIDRDCKGQPHPTTPVELSTALNDLDSGELRGNRRSRTIAASVIDQEHRKPGDIASLLEERS